jgi:hypothetical protein
VRLHVVLASFAAGIGLATPAQADPDPDASFLAALNNAGITYQSGPDAVGIGRRAWQLMDQGHSEPDVIKGMTEQNGGFTTDAATKFTQIAESIYCPSTSGERYHRRNPRRQRMCRRPISHGRRHHQRCSQVATLDGSER